MTALIQNFAIWILKKTKYQFKIDHDKFKIQIQPVGVGETPTRYDMEGRPYRLKQK